MRQEKQHMPLLDSFIHSQTNIEQDRFGDFPGGPVVKNPPCTTGDTASIPVWGTKIPQAWGSRAHVPQLLKPVRSGACVPQLQRSPCTTQKSLCAAAKTQHGQNGFFLNKKDRFESVLTLD